MNKLAQNVVSYIEVTGKALGVAGTVVKEAHTAKQAALEVIPKVVDRMVEIRLIPDSARKQASTELANHADSLEIMFNVIEELHGQLKEANSKIASLNQGQPEGTPGNKASQLVTEDADAALLALVPQLRDRIHS